jgi:beta-glucosidase
VYTEHQKTPVVAMVRNLKPGLMEPGFSYEISTTITPKTTGPHTLAARVTGSFSLFVESKTVLSVPDQPEVTMEDFLFEPARLEHRISVFMEAGKPYLVRLLSQARIPRENDYEPTPHGATLCYEEFSDERALIAEAVQAASSADVSIIFAGRNQQYESEGFDLDSMNISEPQVRLIRAVTAVSKKTALVLNCGNPIDVSPFVNEVDAILNAHFPGQEGGQAIANILTGKTNPSGRLATTWPKKFDEEHVPTYHNFPARLTERGYEIKYEEGLQIGYRHPQSQRTAQWQFGHGLSYTTFEYSGLTVSGQEITQEARDSDLKISVRVKNTGIYPGHEVVQLYISPPDSTVWRPARELKGYAKVWILPGESETVTISLNKKHAFSYWDEDAKQWRLEPGTYHLLVGPFSTPFEIEHSLMWAGR